MAIPQVKMRFLLKSEQMFLEHTMALQTFISLDKAQQTIELFQERYHRQLQINGAKEYLPWSFILVEIA